MSFLTDPNLYEVDLINFPDLQCHTALTTPVILFLNLSDIQIGDDWLPGDPPPPNGTWELIHVISSKWDLTTTDFQFEISEDLGVTALIVQLLDFTPIFFNLLTTNCPNRFENDFTNPTGRKYFGGSAILTSPLDTGPNSLQAQMALLNINPFGQNWVKVTNTGANQTTNRFSRRIGKDNILIQYDLT